MVDIKKDHAVGTGTGAAGGAVAGAVAGTAVAGPLGTVVGAVAGGILGAKAGDAVAEKLNPTDYNNYWQNNYKTSSYYAQGREWNDYEPAYKQAYDAYSQNPGKRFEDVEASLERGWENTKANSRLAWNEAREAVRDGWHRIERAIPGDADGDGR